MLASPWCDRTPSHYLATPTYALVSFPSNLVSCMHARNHCGRRRVCRWGWSQAGRSQNDQLLTDFDVALIAPAISVEDSNETSDAVDVPVSKPSARNAEGKWGSWSAINQGSQVCECMPDVGAGSTNTAALSNQVDPRVLHTNRVIHKTIAPFSREI